MHQSNRPLTADEYRLVRWMLEHAGTQAAAYLPQLDLAEVTAWRCDCGCASMQFQIKNKAAPPPGLRPIADFFFGKGKSLSGIFVYVCGELLGGVEVYGLGGDAPKALPTPESLRATADA